MSESDGKSYEYMQGYLAGLRWAREMLKPELVEPYHGKVAISEPQGPC